MPAWLAMIRVTERTIAAAFGDRFCKSHPILFLRLLQKLARNNFVANEITK
jgi:hypothetical protein